MSFHSPPLLFGRVHDQRTWCRRAGVGGHGHCHLLLPLLPKQVGGRPTSGDGSRRVRGHPAPGSTGSLPPTWGPSRSPSPCRGKSPVGASVGVVSPEYSAVVPELSLGTDPVRVPLSQESVGGLPLPTSLPLRTPRVSGGPSRPRPTTVRPSLLCHGAPTTGLSICGGGVPVPDRR